MLERTIVTQNTSMMTILLMIHQGLLLGVPSDIVLYTVQTVRRTVYGILSWALGALIVTDPLEIHIKLLNRY